MVQLLLLTCLPLLPAVISNIRYVILLYIFLNLLQCRALKLQLKISSDIVVNVQVFRLPFHSLTCRPGEDIETVEIKTRSIKRSSKSVTKLSALAIVEEWLKPDQTTDCHKVGETAGGGVCASLSKHAPKGTFYLSTSRFIFCPELVT